MREGRPIAARVGRWVAAAACASLLLAALPAAAQVDGSAVYARTCASCHQAAGEGVAGIFPPVAESEWVTGDPGTLVKIILHGVSGELEVAGELYAGMMPPWGGALSDAEVAAVSTYVRSNFGNQAAPVSLDMVTSVRREYAARKALWTGRELLADGSAIGIADDI